jgi:glycosyltransferase involved in cell wall biosynthesis
MKNSKLSMRVALDGIPLLNAKTGVGKYTSELGAALRRLPGVSDVSVIYGIHWSKHFRGSHFAGGGENEKSLGRERIARRVPDALKAWLRRGAAKLELAVSRPDIFHATNYVSASYEIPMVVTIHDLSFLRYPGTHPPERLKWLEKGLPRTLNEARLIIAVSQFTKDELISLLAIPENRVRVVYLGVTPDYRPRDKELVAEKLKQFDLAPDGYILSVGTLEPRKNISALLDAYESLPHSLKERWPLAIVGLQGWKDHAVADRMEKLSRTGRLRHLGYVPDDKLPFVYAGATLFVYPSLYEGFGLPPLEAMASGVPVISSNRASLPEVAGNAGALVDPEDVGLMAQVMEAVLGDSEKRREMARMGLYQARHFTWEACAENTFRVYREALGQNQA